MQVLEQKDTAPKGSLEPAKPKFTVGKRWRMKCYPDRLLEIVSASWEGQWEYESAYQGKVVHTHTEVNIEKFKLPDVAPGQFIVVAGSTSSDAVVVTHDNAFKVFADLRSSGWRWEGDVSTELIALIDPVVKAYFGSVPGQRFIPAAEYEIGCCHNGQTSAYKSVKIKTDVRVDALTKARSLLRPSVAENLTVVAVRPNPNLEQEDSYTGLVS
jgi:hypothetical protein